MKCFGIPSKAHRCKIILLDDSSLIQEVQSTQKGQEILDIVFKHLSLLETVYFGLRFVNSKGYSCWLNPNQSVIKQVKSIEPITFYFGVKFYAADPCKLVEECTRYQFFLQIKQDIQQSRLTVTNELAAQLLSYIIQSELGDYDPRTHKYGYVSEFRLIANQSSEFESKVCELHKQLIGQIPAAVELQFLERIKWLDLYGCELHPVIAEDVNEYFLGLSPHGIIVLKNKLKVANYYWPRVLKIFRKKRYFMVKVIDKENEENTYGFEMANKDSCKSIHKSCKEHQEFFKVFQNGVDIRLNGSKSARNLQQQQLASRQNGDRPAPMLVRVPSRRYQRMGMPDGSEGTPKGEAATGGEKNFLETKSTVPQMTRHNSTPSLMKPTGFATSAKYANPYAPNKHERGLFSKSANASPLSIRSAFVARYDYVHGNYVSHMKRNSSSLSLQKMKYSRISDNESEVSKCSRSSRHSSRSHQCRHNRSGDDSGTESESSRKRRHRRRYYGNAQEQPQLVEWNDILEKRNGLPLSTSAGNRKQSNAVVRAVANFYREGGEEEHGRPRVRHHHSAYGAPVSRTLVAESRNGYHIPSVDVKKYIYRESIDGSHLSENEKRDIQFTNIESPMYRPFQQSTSTNEAHNRMMDKFESYDKPLSKQNFEYPKPLSSAAITDASHDKERYYGNYGTNYESYPNYGKSQQTLASLGSELNSSQQMATQQMPRVTFQTPHSTAYFSSHDVYQRNMATTLAGCKEYATTKKTHEMSTEL